jgi:glycosyltransferase involved in cell wall biosynthesis
MKILIASIAHFHDRPGGSPKVAFDEGMELLRRGHDVWMIARGEESLPEFEVKDGIKYLRYHPASLDSWNPTRASIHQRAAAAVLKRHLPQVDAIHGHIPLAGLALLDFYGDSVHSSYTVHSPARMEMAIVWKEEGFWRRVTAPAALPIINHFEAECIRRSNAVTALSRYTIDCIQKIHGTKLGQKLRLVPGWVDTSRFVPVVDRERIKVQLGWPTDVPVLFTLRRLVSRMGLDRLLTACHLLQKDGIKFHLIIGGEGPLRRKLESQAGNLGLNGAVTFLGRVEDTVLPIAYAACDVFVLPTSQLECFGIIALEALSTGRPVLATPVGAIPEIIRTFDSSWLASSAGAADIAGLLRRFLKGQVGEHSPTELHNQIYRDYRHQKNIDQFIEATVEGARANGRVD